MHLKLKEYFDNAFRCMPIMCFKIQTFSSVFDLVSPLYLNYDDYESVLVN